MTPLLTTVKWFKELYKNISLYYHTLVWNLDITCEAHVWRLLSLLVSVIVNLGQGLPYLQCQNILQNNCVEYVFVQLSPE